jgi:hypothetical protein
MAATPRLWGASGPSALAFREWTRRSADRPLFCVGGNASPCSTAQTRRHGLDGSSRARHCTSSPILPRSMLYGRVRGSFLTAPRPPLMEALGLGPTSTGSRSASRFKRPTGKSRAASSSRIRHSPVRASARADGKHALSGRRSGTAQITCYGTSVHGASGCHLVAAARSSVTTMTDDRVLHIGIRLQVRYRRRQRSFEGRISRDRVQMSAHPIPKQHGEASSAAGR